MRDLKGNRRQGKEIEMAPVTAAAQKQFRCTRTSLKVLHLRNLTWECSEEELVEPYNAFGKVVNTKCNVGANRNQAFVEFVDLNQAISMVSFYASLSEPPKSVGRPFASSTPTGDIVNNSSSTVSSGTVLLVTIEGVEAGDVIIDVIHLTRL